MGPALADAAPDVASVDDAQDVVVSVEDARDVAESDEDVAPLEVDLISDPPDITAPPPLPLGPSRCDTPGPQPEPRSRLALTPVVTFHELMYHPHKEKYEWLELRNEMRVDVDMSGWRLDDGVRYTFPEGTILAGDATLVVAVDPFNLATGTWFWGALGPYEGKLSNSGERVALYNNAGRLMDVVDYAVNAPWPVTPDGAGVSLAKRGPSLPSWEPSSWAPSVELGGTPGQD
ncbi:MAG: lamin tail domain-containing protein, partial [Myxococcota bacterium]|nr:lamin tail domain-containing protein [Myxococcota bacterium]